MSTAEVLLLGAIAGFTIFLGLPVGRLSSLSHQVKVFLSATAAGVLLFLLWDVLSHAVEPIETSLTDYDWTRFAGLAAIFCLCQPRIADSGLLRTLDDGTTSETG